MGCLCSTPERDRDLRHLYELNQARRNAQYQANYKIEDTRSIDYSTRPIPSYRPRPSKEPVFGEYRCKSCKRSWSSRYSWPGKHQICKNCRTPTYPHKCRKLESSDFTSKDPLKEHKKELCQMCQQLGHSCTKKRN